ncbi:peptide transporter mtd1 [Penicillium longicatenatum]|nr:peptide transporter mtd1 [Penicillium longicatenatum]
MQFRFKETFMRSLDVSKFLVSTRDDGDPSLTFRSIVLGTIFIALSSVITMLYTFKPVQVSVSAVFLQCMPQGTYFGFFSNVSYSACFCIWNAWEFFTPSPDRFKTSWLRMTLKFLNSGQSFGIKEHVVASLIASSGNNGLSVVEVYAIERLFYDRGISATTAVSGTFSISLCELVLAGALRSLIVYPAEMVYWSTLPQVVLFQSLHFDRKVNQARLKKFGWALGLAAAWEFFPAYIVPWVGAPTRTRTILSTIFGGASSNEGMGLLNFSLDWQYIQSTHLSLPSKQQVNTWIGYVIWYPTMLWALL